MGNTELKTLIECTAEAARKAGQTVEYSNTLPFVSFNSTKEHEEYFLQDSEAYELLIKAQTMAEKFAVAIEDFLLFEVQSW